MIPTQFGTLCLALLLVFDMQSLMDFARQEAERRRQLQEQGIQAKVIVNNTAGTASSGEEAASEAPPAKANKRATRSDSPQSHRSVGSYRTALQKLDRQIQQIEERLSSLRAQLHAEKWSLSKTRRASGRSKPKKSASQLQTEIDGLQLKVKHLRDERFDIYESGRKAGFLPGELEGKYTNP
jgi:uncharacterized protein (DUF3084 family)